MGPLVNIVQALPKQMPTLVSQFSSSLFDNLGGYVEELL